jgi:DNA topoisomerase-2
MATIEETYQKLTQHEHILKLPDTYIGSVELDNLEVYVYEPIEKKIRKKFITYVPGLYKIYDEIIVNARDHTVRDPTCTTIRVHIDKNNNRISIYNNGKGIPVEMHKEHKLLVPELIFGHLLTSSSYGSTGKTVGARNGLGGKLCCIYSTEFIVETSDEKNKFVQYYHNNMYNRTEPQITPVVGGMKPYTRITFSPDLKRFGISELTDDIVNLFKKRVYDIAACTNVNVFLNDELIKIDSFEEYINMFYVTPPNVIYEEFNDRWRVGVVYDPTNGFSQISYVNGISTYQGGTHVSYILDQITSKIINILKQKNKNIIVRPSFIRDNLTLFIDCIIEDPSFTSQTKEQLSTKPDKYGSRCEISDAFIQQLAKTGLLAEVLKIAQIKALHEMKKSDGKRVGTLLGLPKLDDALQAGKKGSKHCRLFLTEGDSAKSFAIYGFEVIGTEYYGVFPLRGKILNVRDATPKQLANNEEIKNIKMIMGLKHGKKYTDVSQLRYGGIVILTDQDADGFHIKGLLINFIHFFWPSLAKMKGFIQTLNTPLLKAFKPNEKKPLVFYDKVTFKKWQETNPKGYEIKYYKGLGTSTDKEAKECFMDFHEKLVTYVWDGFDPKIEMTTDSQTDSQQIETQRDTQRDTQTKSQ